MNTPQTQYILDCINSDQQNTGELLIKIICQKIKGNQLCSKEYSCYIICKHRYSDRQVLLSNFRFQTNERKFPDKLLSERFLDTIISVSRYRNPIIIGDLMYGTKLDFDNYIKKYPVPDYIKSYALRNCDHCINICKKMSVDDKSPGHCSNYKSNTTITCKR